MVALICHSTPKTEAGGTQVQFQTGINSETLFQKTNNYHIDQYGYLPLKRKGSNAKEIFVDNVDTSFGNNVG
jgi:hypothetical protein